MTDPSLYLEAWLDQAQKHYLLGNSEPYVINLRQRKGVADFYQQVEVFLRDHSHIKVVNFRRVKEGQVYVSRPCELQVDWNCLLYYCPHLKLLRKEVSEWLQTLAELHLPDFFVEYYADCVREPATTRACLQVFKHLLARDNRSPWMLPRQLPHAESTKLVGKENLLLKLFTHWRGEPGTWTDFFKRFRLLRRQVEFRLFAPQCRFQGHSLTNFHGLIARDWYQQFEFSDLTKTLIIENLQSFESLTVHSKNTLLIWGSGWKVSQLLEFHHMLPRPLYYWGDIDKEGYEIFGYLADKIVDIQPLLMDQAIFDKYQHLSVKKEPFYGPFKIIPQLQQVYETVCRAGKMIEQEKISLQDLALFN